MRYNDWSTLDMGKSWKWGLILFKSNGIIMRQKTFYSTIKTPAEIVCFISFLAVKSVHI